MDAQTEVEEAAVLRRAGGQVTHGCGELGYGFWPHEKDITVLRTQFAGGLADTAEVKKRTAVLLVRLGRIRVQTGVVEVMAVEV